eukprot:6204889-Pleurochrysis_carterae.AAC.1
MAVGQHTNGMQGLRRRPDPVSKLPLFRTRRCRVALPTDPPAPGRLPDEPHFGWPVTATLTRTCMAMSYGSLNRSVAEAREGSSIRISLLRWLAALHPFTA